MKNIFADQTIYPHDGKILEHFSGLYESAFIGFLPFFRVENHHNGSRNFKRSEVITFEQAQNELDMLKDIPEPDATIYSYGNKDYPGDEEIYDRGEIITWNEIISQAGMKDFPELNKALRTSIGALKKIFTKPASAKKLETFTADNNIWHPTEGQFDLFTKVAIYKTFRLWGKNEITVVDEFYQEEKTLRLDELDEWQFAEKIDVKDYYIYSKDRELLFTIEWDSFFFIIASSKPKMERIVAERLFDGFLCNPQTSHDWDYKEGEIDKVLKRQERQKVKFWWQFWK